jgi:hypothetical protein
VLGLSEVCKLPYGGLLVSYRGMTAHALARGRERHQIARIRVRMAELALQTQGQMGFVTIGDGLCWRRKMHWIVG